ncbi:MAG TPA: hypothetical protein VGX24_01275 [Pyrinomonadaceae bacterium]|jgi:hypothetical protein|nr:hypothetical protein [Pyrinomonadaceae bacterium]
MSLYFKIAAISTLLIFSLFSQGGNYKSPRESGSGKGTVKAYNKSPCFQEEVLECQAAGGRYNWSQCFCEYW